MSNLKLSRPGVITSDTEKFYQVLSTRQISDQLDHSNRNYRGGRIYPPRPYEFAKSLACLGLRNYHST